MPSASQPSVSFFAAPRTSFQPGCNRLGACMIRSQHVFLPCQSRTLEESNAHQTRRERRLLMRIPAVQQQEHGRCASGWHQHRQHAQHLHQMHTSAVCSQSVNQVEFAPSHSHIQARTRPLRHAASLCIHGSQHHHCTEERMLHSMHCLHLCKARRMTEALPHVHFTARCLYFICSGLTGI